MSQRAPKFVWVYPAYSEARAAEEEAFAARMRAAGEDVVAFGVPCAGGWWPFPVLDERYRSGDRGLHAAYAELARLLDGADVLVAAGGAMLHPAFLDQMAVRKLFVCADDPENSANLSRPVAAHFDHCFVVNIACVDDYRAWGCRSASWLPPVLRPERVAAGVDLRSILGGERAIDVAFCGDGDFGIGDRSRRLDALVHAFPQAWLRGRAWPAGEVAPEQVAAAYARTKLGWNLHHSIGPCNTRLLELPANGVLQLCDNRSHLGRIFRLDEEVVGFDTVDECIDKTRYYLAHDDERRRIAAAGWERVQREYTEAHQWQRIRAAAMPAATAPRQQALPAIVLCSPRPRVWLLADRRGWAYDREAQAMATQLEGEFECRIAYVQEQPDLSRWDYDLLWVFFWGETWHQRFAPDPRAVVKMVGSHRWQNEVAYGPLDPGTFAATHLRDAATVAAISPRLCALLAPFRGVDHAPQGVDEALFHAGLRAPAGPLRVGWAGNRDDACKGLTDVLEPACADRWQLHQAGGNVPSEAMATFYRDLDVLCVASTAEGGPLPLLEALACGAFVVTTDVGIAREVVTHGDNGLIVARTEAAFRAALHWCEANVERLRAGRTARAETLAATRSWPAVIEARAEILRTALQRLRGASASAETTSPLVATADSAPIPILAGVSSPGDDLAPRASPTTTVLTQLKTAYRDHLHGIAGDSSDADTHAAACAYYRAELDAVLPSDHDAPIAEVGCGFGHLLRFLADGGHRNLCGVDHDPALAAATAQRLGARATVLHGDAIEFLRSAPAHFDLVLAYDILEHFDLDGAVALAKAARQALRPSGRAVFRTPNMANLLGGYSRWMDLTHRIGFTEQSARQLLTAAGFADVAVVEPRHEPGPLADGIAQSRRLHEQLFAWQDRSRPTCFDKNLVLVATAPAAVAARAPAAPACSGARA